MSQDTAVGQDTFVSQDTAPTTGQDTTVSQDNAAGTDTTTGTSGESLSMWQEAPVDGMQTETACGCQTARQPRGMNGATWLIALLGGVVFVRRRRS